MKLRVLRDIDKASGFDLVVLVTAHKSSIDIDWEKLLSKMRKPLLYDGRRVLDLEKLSEMGWEVSAVGKPWR